MSRSALKPEQQLQVLLGREEVYGQTVKRYAVGVFKRLRANRELMECPVTLVDRFAGDAPDDDAEVVREWARDLSLWAGRFGLDRILVPCSGALDLPFRAPVGGALPFQVLSCEHRGVRVLALRTRDDLVACRERLAGGSQADRPVPEALCEVLRGGGFGILEPHGAKAIRDEIGSWSAWPDQPFGVIVASGAGLLFDAFDAGALRAIAAWDRLLAEGRRVLGLGMSDAAHPWCIGTVFTGAIVAEPDREGFVRTAAGGRLFFSNGPFLDVQVNGVPMGGSVPRTGKRIEIHFRAADARGFLSVRCVASGETIREFEGKGRRNLDVGFLANMPTQPMGIRCEALAMDGRRVFSNPIFVV